MAERQGGVRRFAAVVVAISIAAAVGLVAAPAGAETISVPIPDAVVSGEPGSTVALGSAPVPAELQGRSCAVAIVVTNQISEHPGNELVVSSGDSQVVVPGIEDVANEVTSAEGTVTLGESIDVSVKLGPNSNITSLGSSLTVTCEPLPAPPPPTPEPK
ncbi:MAG: hypothetical protein ACR2QK_14010, partial [Acidimicrobiales bacterium]